MSRGSWKRFILFALVLFCFLVIVNNRVFSQHLKKIAKKESLSRVDNQVFINEVFSNPLSKDKENEYIELYNPSLETVSLSGWQLKDTYGQTSTYFLKEEIPPLDLLVLSSSQTKIILNNDKDGLLLLSPQGEIVDEVEYENAPEDYSLIRVNDEWFWTPFLSPGAENYDSQPLFSLTELNYKGFVLALFLALIFSFVFFLTFLFFVDKLDLVEEK